MIDPNAITAYATCALAIMTGAYLVVTYWILCANQETVRAIKVQASEEKSFRTREHFLTGIDTIAQYDINSPGCPQAMRLLDYYSWIALDANDPDLFFILNTMMTDAIRKKLEEIDNFHREEYPYAVKARKHVMNLLKDFHMKRKKDASEENSDHPK